MALNRAQIQGHVGKDADVRTLDSGNKKAAFSVATTETWTDKQTGEEKEKTEWHRVVVFGDALIDKVVAPYVKKGTPVYIEGQLRTREYTGEDGVKRYVTEIVVQGFGGMIRTFAKMPSNRPPEHDAEPDSPYASRPQSAAGGQMQSRLDHQAPHGHMPPAGNPGRPNVNGGVSSNIDDVIPF